jgi:hypothetical protein
MKRQVQISAATLLLMLCLTVQNKSIAQYYPDDNYNQDRDISYQTFYDELSPHGQWVDYPGHGYVWVPDAEDDFQPYSTNGHWVYNDDYEWVWVSDYHWGWAPFHYGRWDHDDYYGWYWVPGYEWAPAWVAWRDGGEYYGWAPLRPGISININIGGYNPPSRFWCFTPRRYITHDRWYDYRVDWRQNVTIINYTTVINYNGYRSGYGFRCGPRRYEAERYCGRINPVRFRDTYSPGRTFYRNNEVSFYRPRVREDNNRQIAPRSFERYDRSNGSFRNQGRVNEGSTNRNDGFRRENDNIRRPDDRDRMNNDNRGFRRNDANNGRSQNNNPRFDRQPRTENNSGNRPDDGRIYRPGERTNQPSNNGGNNDNRFERRSYERNNGNAPNREFSTNDNRRQPPQRMERRYEQPQQPLQRMERRYEQPQPRQMERRYEQPQTERRPPQQQPARQAERRSDDNRQQGGGGNGSVSGGRGRFSRN